MGASEGGWREVLEDIVDCAGDSATGASAINVQLKVVFMKLFKGSNLQTKSILGLFFSCYEFKENKAGLFVLRYFILNILQNSHHGCIKVDF